MVPLVGAVVRDAKMMGISGNPQLGNWNRIQANDEFELRGPSWLTRMYLIDRKLNSGSSPHERLYRILEDEYMTSCIIHLVYLHPPSVAKITKTELQGWMTSFLLWRHSGTIFVASLSISCLCTLINNQQRWPVLWDVLTYWPVKLRTWHGNMWQKFHVSSLLLIQ